MTMVKDPDSMQDESWDFILHQDNRHRAIELLVERKRDTESQFIASKTRLKDFYADCEHARLNCENVEIETETYNKHDGIVRRQTETLSPTIAYARFQAKEYRWRMKTVRYLSRIESAILLLKNHDKNETKRNSLEMV